jgi:transcriptional regulator with XRE-family HTH domain
MTKKIRHELVRGKNLRLREWAYQARVTLKDLEECFDISRTYLYWLMKGKKNPGAKLMKRIKEITLGKVPEEKYLLDEGYEAKPRKAKRRQ